jgi:DASH complex subunit DAD2
MSNYGRPLPSHLRNQSLGGSQQQSPVLLARIAEKKAELGNLKDLQALSGGLADQMQMLADKLSTLSDGTEGRSIRCNYLPCIQIWPVFDCCWYACT